MKLFGNTNKTKKHEDGKRRHKALRVLLIVLAALVLLLAVGFALYKIWAKPPEINIEGLGQLTTTTTTRRTTTKTDSHGNIVTEPTQSADTTTTTQPARTFTRKKNVYTFLIVGIDKGYGNTDTIIVGSLDTKAHTLNMISIPRDTMVNVPWSIKKVNSIYGHSGITGLTEELREILGFKVDCYVSVDLDGFVKLVDAIGGIDFDVPTDMNYDDPTQGLSIHFTKGYQHLDGMDAMKVARFRGYSSADIGRINTQQKLLRAIAKRCLSLSGVMKIGDMVNVFKNYVKTDLSTSNLLWMAQEFLKVDSSNMKFATLPGNYADSVNGQSYVTVYVNKWLNMLNEMLNPYEESILYEDLSILTRGSDGKLYVTDGSAIEGGSSSFWGS